MDEKIKILDELSKIQIEQLHNTTLSISKQSFEVKKLYIITLTALISIFSFKNITILFFSCLVVTFLFYIVDSFLYHYQRNLRNNMITEENKIYERNGIDQLNFRKSLSKIELSSAFFNSSQVSYYIVFGVLIFSSILKFFFVQKVIIGVCL